jgi:putative hydrolases of HD superfamily
MENLIYILKFLNKAEKLKTVKRAVNISDNSRKESPAEHTWRMALMAIILNRELKLEVDLLKSLEIILVHDIIEAIAWDIFVVDKNDKKVIELKEKRELEAAKEIYSLLPESIWTDLKNLWFEFENGNSKEALFAQALDKIEVIIQRCDMWVKNWERDDIFELLLHRSDASVKKFPELKDLWRLVQEELIKQFNE